jgi:hypothetical protein
MSVPAPRFDAFASTVVVDPNGDRHFVVALREPSGRLRLRIDDVSVRGIEGVFGAQLAAGDLDQDGSPEIVTTNDGEADAVNVLTWTSAKSGPSSASGPNGAAGQLVPRLHLPAPAGVRALAMCPAEQGGEPALLAVVGDEVWLVRAQSGPDEKAGNE